MLAEIRGEFGLSYGGAAALLATYDAGYAVTLIAGGYVATAIGRRVAIVASGLLLGGTAIASAWAAGSLPLFLLYRFVAGFAFSLYFTSGFSLIGEVFLPNERGRAYGLHTVGSATGRAYGAALVGAVAALAGWRVAFTSYGLLALALGIGFWFTTRGVEDRPPGDRRPPLRLLEILRRPSFQAASLLNALLFTNFFVASSFLPVYLREVKGLELGETTFLFTLINLVAFVANPGLGWLSDRWKRLHIAYLIFACNIVLLLLLPVVPPGWPLLVFGICFGFFLTANVGVIAAYLMEAHPQHRQAVALGLFNTSAVLSGIVVNTLLGSVADLFGLPALFNALALYVALGMGAGLFIVRRVSLVPA